MLGYKIEYENDWIVSAYNQNRNLCLWDKDTGEILFNDFIGYNVSDWYIIGTLINPGYLTCSDIIYIKNKGFILKEDMYSGNIGLTEVISDNKYKNNNNMDVILIRLYMKQDKKHNTGKYKYILINRDGKIREISNIKNIRDIGFTKKDNKYIVLKTDNRSMPFPMYAYDNELNLLDE